MTKEIRLLSGGAAQGLVTPLRESFQAQSGYSVQGTFGAVGAMRDKLLAGEPCDIVILTQAIIDQLAADGHVVRGSEVPLGVVKTGIAVKSGEPSPRVDSAESLKAALLSATGIYLPDPQKATAGIHFVKVLEQLGIAGELAARRHPVPNGAAAMHAMAQSAQAGAIGCTQVTEILFAPGVELAGLLPTQFELATVYTAAVCTQAREPGAAREFIRMMAGADAAALRAKGGFEA